MVMSEKIYSAEEYLESMTGKYFLLNKENTVEEIEKILDKHFGERSFWSYPLNEIDHIVENDFNTVLVDVSGHYDETWQIIYRWFQVPEDFEETTKATSNKEEYFGKIRWCKNDIADALDMRNYPMTKNNIDIIYDALTNNHSFVDHMIESGWDYIYSQIDNTTELAATAFYVEGEDAIFETYREAEIYCGKHSISPEEIYEHKMNDNED